MHPDPIQYVPGGQETPGGGGTDVAAAGSLSHFPTIRLNVEGLRERTAGRHTEDNKTVGNKYAEKTPLSSLYRRRERTTSAIRRICSGVEPQQAPTMSQPASRSAG